MYEAYEVVKARRLRVSYIWVLTCNILWDEDGEDLGLTSLIYHIDLLYDVYINIYINNNK